VDAAAIIAASTKVDTPFVMAVQTLRVIVVLAIGPQVARWVAGTLNPFGPSPRIPRADRPRRSRLAGNSPSGRWRRPSGGRDRAELSDSFHAVEGPGNPRPHDEMRNDDPNPAIPAGEHERPNRRRANACAGGALRSSGDVHVMRCQARRRIGGL